MRIIICHRISFGYHGEIWVNYIEFPFGVIKHGWRLEIHELNMQFLAGNFINEWEISQHAMLEYGTVKKKLKKQIQACLFFMNL